MYSREFSKMHNLTMHSCTYHNPSQDDFIPNHARTTIPYQATKHKFRLSTRHREPNTCFTAGYRYHTGTAVYIVQLYSSTYIYRSVNADGQFLFSELSFEQPA